MNDTQTREPDHASWATKINYGIGAVGKGLSNGLSGRLQLYLLTVLRIDKRLLGPILFIGRVWDGVNDLMMGAIIDNTRTKWGKFRPWIAIGAVTNAMVMIGLFGAPGGLRANHTALYSYITALWLLWSITYTMIDVAYYAMIPALSSAQKERDQFAMIPRIFSGLLGIVGAFNLNIITWLGGGEKEEQQVKGFFYYAALTSIVYVATSLYCAALVKEPRAAPRAEPPKFSVRVAVRTVINNKQALVVVGVMLLFNLATNMTNTSKDYYFRFVIHNETQIGLFGVTMGAANGVGLLAYPLLTRRFKRERVYFSAWMLPIAGYALMAAANLLAPGQFVPLAAGAFVGSVGFGFMMVMQSVMLADTVDYGEWETGVRSEGLVFCMLTMLSKLAGAANDLIVMTVFQITKFGGQDASTATPAALVGFQLLMYVLPVPVLLASLWLYKAKYKLTPERMERVKAELQ